MVNEFHNLLKNHANIRNILFISGFIILATVLQGYRVFYAVAERYNRMYISTDSSLIKISRNGYLNPLLKDISFLKARIIQAGTDSVALYIDLADSVIGLELKGISLMQQKITSYQCSRIFEAIEPASLITMTSRPLSITSDTASIPKENIITLKAPKNEEESARFKNQIMQDTASSPIAVRLEIEDMLVILIDQNHSPESSGVFSAYHKFILYSRLKDHLTFCRDALTWRSPAYLPRIKIHLPSNDIKSIYRALPENAKIILKV